MMDEHGTVVLIRDRTWTPPPPSGWLITRSGAREVPWCEHTALVPNRPTPVRPRNLKHGVRLPPRRSPAPAR